MKAGRRLDRGYERLAASERFRLAVAAEARGDTDEVERLFRSCPRQAYQLLDPAFSDRGERSVGLTKAVIAELYAIGGKLDVLAAAEHAARVLFAAAADEAEFEAFRITGLLQPSVRRAVRGERGRFRRLFRRIRGTLLTEGATVAHAFAAVCHDELQVEPQQLVAAVAGPYTDLFERFIGEAPDPAALEAIRSELADAWRVGIGEQPGRDRRWETT